MNFLDFARNHGIVIDTLPPIGVWRRYKTDDKAGKKNGAVIFNGDSGAVQNWATMTKPEVWRPDVNVRPITEADRAAFAKKRREREDTQEKQWGRAAARAQQMLDECRPGEQGYPKRKGFHGLHVLVMPDGGMLVPMRSFETDALVGAQTIHWMPEERVWQKRFLPGMRAKGAVFKVGPRIASETVLVEGWATAQSVSMAIDQLKLRMNVIACFSAGNITAVAPRISHKAFVFADHDPSGVGQETAAKTGLPWTMSPHIGEDANDLHQKHGLRALSGMLLDLRRKRA